jgi:hypothetical protein
VYKFVVFINKNEMTSQHTRHSIVPHATVRQRERHICLFVHMRECYFCHFLLDDSDSFSNLSMRRCTSFANAWEHFRSKYTARTQYSLNESANRTCKCKWYNQSDWMMMNLTNKRVPPVVVCVCMFVVDVNLCQSLSISVNLCQSLSIFVNLCHLPPVVLVL